MDTTAQQPVLVSGASGFIGTRLVRRLFERHFRVSCLVRGTSNVDGLRAAGAQLILGDVTDRSSVERALAESQARIVFHLAGIVKTHRPGFFTKVNVGGVENVAAACANCTDHPNAGKPPVLVVVSSLAAAGPCAGDELRVERDSPAPVSNYGRSKLAGEQVAAKYAGTVPITIVRPAIVFGPGDRGVLQMFRPIARWGLHVVPCAEDPGGRRGDARVSMVHVDDLVEALLLAAEKGERLRELRWTDPPPPPAEGQGIYFIAGEENPTYAELGHAIATALGRKPPVVLRLPGPLVRLVGIGGDMASWICRCSGWVNSDKITEALVGSWTCSSAKARTQLGWSPAAPLAARLDETAQGYRQAGWL